MNFIYKIFTLDGRKLDVEATSADHACELAGIPREQCRPWYPFAVKAVLSAEERAAREARFEQLKQLKAERRALRNGHRTKTVGTISPPKTELNSDLPAGESSPGENLPKKKGGRRVKYQSERERRLAKKQQNAAWARRNRAQSRKKLVQIVNENNNLEM